MPRLVLTTFTTLTLALGSSKVFAQPPTAFGNWTADQGTITTPCPNGFTCTPIAQDSGFLQREVINPTTGEIFVQSILTDNGATGAPGALEFAMEDFVRINPGTQPVMPGIASNLHIGSTPDFSFDFELLRGAVAPPGFGQTGKMNQVVRDFGDPATASDDLESRFAFEGAGRDNARVGRRIEISQDLAQGLPPGAQAADVQGMHMVVAEGELQPTAGQASLPGGGTVTWQAGDTLVAGWLGTTGTGGTLGHQAYMNLTSGQQTVINDFSDPGPFGWPVDAFGPAPTLPAGTP